MCEWSLLLQLCDCVCLAAAVVPQALINPPRAGRAELARRDHKEHAAAAGGEGGEARQHPVFRVGDRVIQQVRVARSAAG